MKNKNKYLAYVMAQNVDKDIFAYCTSLSNVRRHQRYVGYDEALSVYSGDKLDRFNNITKCMYRSAFNYSKTFFGSVDVELLVALLEFDEFQTHHEYIKDFENQDLRDTVMELNDLIFYLTQQQDTFGSWLDSDPWKSPEFIDRSAIEELSSLYIANDKLKKQIEDIEKEIKEMNDTKYTVLIDYSFNGKVETLNAGIMDRDECEDFIEETITEKEWVNVKKHLSDEDEFKKFINVHNIAYMRLVRVRSVDRGEYVVVEEQ